jgi:hypothetical protein
MKENITWVLWGERINGQKRLPHWIQEIASFMREIEA